MAKSIITIIPYFGKWPEWINFFIESCKHNPGVDWLIVTDCGEPDNSAPNVHFRHMSFEDYKAEASRRLEVGFNPLDPYKLCDLKAAFGVVHEDDIRDYDYYAHSDIDLIYGDIRRFWPDEILQRYQVISHNQVHISGPFAILENTESVRHAFMHIPDWSTLLVDQKHHGLDEMPLYHAMMDLNIHCSLQEQFCTNLVPIPWHDGNYEHPLVWHWCRGRLTNERDGEREFPFLHFTNWIKHRYVWPEVRKLLPPAWEDRKRIVYADYKNPHWIVSPSGFENGS